MLKKVLIDEGGVIDYPAKYVANKGTLTWHLDHQSASKLEYVNG